MASYVNPANFGRINPKEWKKYPDIYTSCYWPAQLPHSPKDYGDPSFHGRTHPDIIFAALERYTKPGDKIWDPAAGSGTTIDVCEELGNPCIATDLAPVRGDILARDARVWRPDEQVQMVIFHPPYNGVIQYAADKPGETLATNDIVEYLDKMEQVFDNIDRALEDWHVLVLIVGMVYVESETLLLDHECLNLLDSFGQYRVLGRVTRDYGETKGGKATQKKSGNLWKYRRFAGGYWSLGLDTVLFLQKVGD